MAELTDPRSPELLQLLDNKEEGYNYRQRRHDKWFEIYTLYRDEVIINRLTQRQSVHVPMMKQQIRSLLKDVDDMPVIYFENLDNDKQKEVFQNEYWDWTIEQNNMELQDIVDKKQAFLFGRTFMQMQIIDGRVVMTIQDPQDILVSRYTDPTDLNTSRYLIHTGIFKSLGQIEKNELYDKAAIARLKEFYSTQEGLIKVASNERMAQEKSERMQQLGVTDADMPELGETVVELTLHFVYAKEEGDEEEQLYLKVEADAQQIIMSKRLEEVIGETEDHYWRNHYPYDSWADDVERQDFWSDGIGDIIRTPNKIADSYWSQLVENRTLRNFGMNYYDSSDPDFNPGTFVPIPGGWYPLPGKPSDILQRVEIPDLSESLDELKFLIETTEQATGATKTQQGAVEDRSITLGEVQLAFGEAKERSKGMSKFYTAAWKRRGKMFLKFIEAGGDSLDVVKIYHKGRNTNNVFTREIQYSDWMSKSGYDVKVWSQEEKQANDTETLQKLNATVTFIPGNKKLIEIYQRKLLEFARLTPEEVNEVMQIEADKMEALLQGQQNGMMLGQTPMQPNPAMTNNGARPARTA